MAQNGRGEGLDSLDYMADLPGLLENSSLGFYRTTPDGRILMANGWLIRKLGYGNFEEISEVNLEESARRLQGFSRKNFKKTLEREGRVLGLKTSALTKEGREIHFYESAWAVRDGEGEVSFYEGIIQDVTRETQFEDLVKRISGGLSTLGGEEFFLELGLLMEQIFGTECLLLGELPEDESEHVLGRVVWSSSKSSGEPVWDAGAGLIEEVLRRKMLLLDREQWGEFPMGNYIESCEASSFFGIALHDSSRRPFGLLCGLNRREIGPRRQAEFLLNLLSLRASEEYEHLRNLESVQWNYQTQKALSSLLAASLENPPLEELMDLAIDPILTILSPSFQSRAAIHLVEEDPDILVLKAHRGLDGDKLEDFRLVRFGSGPCGSAASTRTMQCHDGDAPGSCGPAAPGHCAFPILSGDRLLGVFSVWHEPGRRPVRREKAFIEVACRTLTGVVERWRANRSMRIMEKALDTMPIGLTITDMRARILYSNPADARMHRYTPEELVGKESSIFAPQEMKHSMTWPEFRDVWMRESINVRKGGSRFPVRLMSVRVEDEQGVPMGVITTCEDITRLKRAERDLLRLTSAVEQAEEAIFITDTKGIILYVNPAFTTTTGYAKDEVIGKNPRMLQSGVHDENFYQDLWKTVGKGEVWRGHFVNKRKDGAYFFVQATITPIRNEEGEVCNFVCDMLDETEQVEIGKKLQEQQKLAAIGGVAAGIAHEIKNPLFAITSGLQLLELELNLDQEQEKTLGILLQECRRMDRLIKQLRAYSTQAELRRASTDAGEIIESVLVIHRGVLQGRKMQVNLSLEEDLPPLYVDRDRVLQVLMNILQNAIEVSPDGGGIEIAAAKSPLKNSVLIQIKDRGPGLPKEHVDQIFEPFFTTKKGNSGMGLAISNKIVMDHGGKILAEPREGGGSIFTVVFPLKEWRHEFHPYRR